ncbi:TetR/AcrR family transcriptional regulator [Arthrobacter sp. NPDC090010]|uniref:TetR/AcrR family transcriptional regulator n=1 Tax=Arthrobacter sp. NPDC090010 TaxID=3363942 RepID=UPI0038228073
MRAGRYAKGEAKREEILRTALEVFASEGYHGTSIREIARRCGLSGPGLLHYFGSRENLLTEVLQARAAFNSQTFFAGEPDAIEALMKLLDHNETVPGLISLYLVLAGDAGAPEHPAATYFASRFPQARELITHAVRAQGLRPRAGLNDDEAASILIAVMDGIQVQWQVDKSRSMKELVLKAGRSLYEPISGNPSSEPS